MSLGIVFKGPEGLVFAADSRVTLTFQPVLPPPPPGAPPHPVMIIPAFYDNATKLLRCQNQSFIAAVTYGLGAIGLDQPRTAHSYMPEFETELAGNGRLTVETFAKHLGDFFLKQFQKTGMVVPPDNNMHFLVGGYNEGESYGRVYELAVPSNPIPAELNSGIFGVSWGGQTNIVHRVLNSFDPEAIAYLKQKLTINDADMEAASKELAAMYSLKIPYQFLPLQDCVDLSILLVKTTSQLMKYTTDVRGVGGAIDVATITRVGGYQDVQTKQICGERPFP